MDEIKNAYRKLAMKYNPKINKDKEVERRFVEINEAYCHLSDEFKRRQYDQFTFGEILPTTAHNIFSDFFTDRDFLSETDRKLFKPLIKQTNKLMNRVMNQPLISSGLGVSDVPIIPRVGWQYPNMLMSSPSRLWDSDLSSKFWDVDLYRPTLGMIGDTDINIDSLGPETQFAESLKRTSHQFKDSQGRLVGKTITDKSELKNGKKVHVKIV
jgi:curved DNA-binding protein CbpA